MHNPKFEQFLAPARGAPQLWRLFLGLGVIIAASIGFFSTMLVILYPILTAIDPVRGPINYFGYLQQLQQPDAPWLVLFVLTSFMGLAIGVFLAVSSCHRRGPGTLIGPARATTRAFFTAVLVLLPLFGLLLCIGYFFTPTVSNLEPGRWLRLLPVATALIFVQIAAEELVFRGYLVQQLAVRFAARWIWMGLPAILFGLLHFDPRMGASAWLVVGATFIFALIATDLTERTGNLGAALALHFVNNLSALLAVSVQGTITGLALFVTEYDITSGKHLPVALLGDALFLLIVWRVLRRAVS